MKTCSLSPLQPHTWPSNASTAQISCDREAFLAHIRFEYLAGQFDSPVRTAEVPRGKETHDSCVNPPHSYDCKWNGRPAEDSFHAITTKNNPDENPTQCTLDALATLPFLEEHLTCDAVVDRNLVSKTHASYSSPLLSSHLI